jgi:hypothetical protein
MSATKVRQGPRAMSQWADNEAEFLAEGRRQGAQIVKDGMAFNSEFR